jgi:uncharacterized membrane protein (DUF373 family)
MAGPDDSAGETGLTRIIKGFERVIIVVLIGLLMIVVSIATVELGWMLLKDLSSTRVMVLDVDEIFELFGLFLLVLIGVELLTTLKVYLRRGAVHGEVVLEVALIAVAQKVIVLDTSRTSAMSVFGTAALILALAAAFWWVRAGWHRPGISSGK